jgi:hypothetical protein
MPQGENYMPTTTSYLSNRTGLLLVDPFGTDIPAGSEGLLIYCLYSTILEVQSDVNYI